MPIEPREGELWRVPSNVWSPPWASFDVAAIEHLLRTSGAALLRGLTLDQRQLLLPARQLDADKLAHGFDVIGDALALFAANRNAGTDALTAFLVNAKTAYRGDAPTPRVNVVQFYSTASPRLLLFAPPVGAHEEARYFAELHQQRVGALVVFERPPWLAAHQRRVGDFIVQVQVQRSPHAAAQAGGAADMFWVAVRPIDGEAAHALPVLHVPWPAESELTAQRLAASVHEAEQLRGRRPLAVQGDAALGRAGTFALSYALSRYCTDFREAGRHNTFEQVLLSFLRLRLQSFGAIASPQQFVAAVQSFA